MCFVIQIKLHLKLSGSTELPLCLAQGSLGGAPQAILEREQKSLGESVSQARVNNSALPAVGGSTIPKLTRISFVPPRAKLTTSAGVHFRDVQHCSFSADKTSNILLRDQGGNLTAPVTSVFLKAESLLPSFVSQNSNLFTKSAHLRDKRKKTEKEKKEMEGSRRLLDSRKGEGREGNRDSREGARKKGNDQLLRHSLQQQHTGTLRFS